MKKELKEVNKWFLVVCGAVILSVVVMVVFVLVNDGDNSKQLVCQSNEGNITLVYDNNTVVGFTASTYTYDLLSEKERAEEMGVEKYIDEFASIFNTNTMGTCTKEK